MYEWHKSVIEGPWSRSRVYCGIQVRRRCTFSVGIRESTHLPAPNVRRMYPHTQGENHVCTCQTLRGTVVLYWPNSYNRELREVLIRINLVRLIKWLISIYSLGLYACKASRKTNRSSPIYSRCESFAIAVLVTAVSFEMASHYALLPNAPLRRKITNMTKIIGHWSRKDVRTQLTSIIRPWIKLKACNPDDTN